MAQNVNVSQITMITVLVIVSVSDCLQIDVFSLIPVYLHDTIFYYALFFPCIRPENTNLICVGLTSGKLIADKTIKF